MSLTSINTLNPISLPARREECVPSRDACSEGEETPHLSDALAHSEIGSALLRHFSKYGDIYVRPAEL